MWMKDELSALADKTFWGVPITIEHLHGNLHGNIHYPPNFQPSKTAHRFPAVLLLHGLGGTRHEHNGLFMKLAASLALVGFMALRIDFRGAGETGGSTLDMTLKTQIQDATDAFEFLKSHRYVDPTKVGIIGLSFGGLTAACVAAARSDVNGLALWEPVFDMKATMKRLYGPLSLKSVKSRGYLQAGMTQLSPAFFDALEEINVEKTVASFANPVLIVQGVADAVVPVDTAYQWKRAYISTEAEVHLIQDADHAFTHEKWSWDAIDHTTDWMKAVLFDGHKTGITD